MTPGMQWSKNENPLQTLPATYGLKKRVASKRLVLALKVTSMTPLKIEFPME